MSALTYLDTSALMRRAESISSDPTGRNLLIAPVLEGILNDSGRRFACSEFTLLEFHTNVTVHLLGPAPHYDQDWWDEAVGQFMGDLASGKIQVLAAPPRAAEHVMSLVTVATGALKRKLRAWDAMHAVVAARWAEDANDAVTILTTDSDFDVISDVMVGFDQLHVENLDVLAQTGEGADRAK